MPNWNNNKLEIVKSNNEDGFETIKNIVQTKKNTQCELFDSLIGKRSDYTKENWYDHNIAYYGTKWDVYYDQFIKLKVLDNTIHIEFDTAWCPPIEFAEELCKRYEVDCVLKYYEAACDFAGCYIVVENDGIDDRRSTIEGWYIHDRNMFWDNLEFMYDLRYSEVDEFVNSLRSFVSSDDIKKVKSYFEE